MPRTLHYKSMEKNENASRSVCTHRNSGSKAIDWYHLAFFFLAGSQYLAGYWLARSTWLDTGWLAISGWILAGSQYLASNTSAISFQVSWYYYQLCSFYILLHLFSPQSLQLKACTKIHLKDNFCFFYSWDMVPAFAKRSNVSRYDKD